jgi:hypothetical protein
MLSKAVYRIAQANNNVKKLKCLNTSKSVSTMWLMPHQGFQCGNSTKLKSFDIEDEEHNKGDMHMLYTNNRKCEETSNSPGKIRGSTRRDRDAGLRTPSQPASPPLHKTTTPRRRESILAYKHMTHTRHIYTYNHSPTVTHSYQNFTDKHIYMHRSCPHSSEQFT